MSRSRNAAAPARSGATGPRTIAGKLASSRNSLKHGLTAKQTVLPGEDPAAFDALHAQLRDAHKPAPGIETLLVEQLAHASWRLNRARRLELEALDAGLNAGPGEPPQLDRIVRYLSAIEREFHRCIKELTALQSIRSRNEIAAGKTKSDTFNDQLKLMSVRTRQLEANWRCVRAHLEHVRETGAPLPLPLQNELSTEEFLFASPQPNAK